MSKTYVFMNRRIIGIDGSIQYIYNKSTFLKSKGYKVIVLSVCSGKILVKSFEDYSKYIIPDMRFVPSLFRKSERDRIVDRALSLLNDYSNDELIIESTSPVSALWGELIAKKLNCRHVYFHLMEKTTIREDLRDFCRYKYERGELAGITAKTVPLLLGDDTVQPIEISAYCNNVFADCEDSFSAKLNPKAKYTIGSIGRLEKPYVPIFADRLAQYFEKNQDIQYNLIMIGGDGNGKAANHLHQVFDQCPNVNFIITDYIYPIPLSLINNIDLFISTAGSSGATYKLKKPTIKLHPITGIPIGIIGCDFKLREKTMYDAEPSFSIENCVERIISGDAKIVYEHTFDEENNDAMSKEFERQLNLVLSNQANLCYYDTQKIGRIKTPFKSFHHVYAFLGHIIGGEGLRRIERLLMNKDFN